MPSPITSADFPPISQSGDVCDQLFQLVQTNDKLRQFFEWLLDDAGNLSDDFKAALVEVVLPVGMVVWRPVESVPDGWLLCNGQSVSRTDYAALFAVIGTQYGSDNATTFKVPNLQERYTMGAGGTHSVSQTFGEANHTLSVSELPAHTHFTLAAETATIDSYPDATAGSAVAQRANSDSVSQNYRLAKASVAATLGLSSAQGGTIGHNNLPPSMAGLFLIRT